MPSVFYFEWFLIGGGISFSILSWQISKKKKRKEIEKVETKEKKKKNLTA